MFAAYLKLLMPVIIVLPGIAAVVLAPNLARPDEAYPTMMACCHGLLGLVFAALVAAIVASTASKINSIATIFTLDLYTKAMHTRAEDDSGSQRGKATGAGRPHRRGRRVVIACCRASRCSAIRPGVSVHPGIHRLLHAGDHA